MTLWALLDAWDKAAPGTPLVVGIAIGAVLISALVIWVEVVDRFKDKEEK